MDESTNESIKLRQQLMKGWWEGFGEQPKIDCSGGVEIRENTVRQFLDDAKAAVVMPKKGFRLLLTADDGKDKPKFLTMKKTSNGYYSAVAVTNVNKICWIAEGQNRATVLSETESRNNFKLQMYLFFCMGEDTGIVGNNGQAMFRKKLTTKEIEFMMAVSLSETFTDGNLLHMAMPYFNVDELEKMFQSMQDWLTSDKQFEKKAEVKNYLQIHYEHTYNLVMVPLQSKYG